VNLDVLGKEIFSNPYIVFLRIIFKFKGKYK